MSNTLYLLYRKDIYTLCKTLIVKHLAAASMINQSLIDLGYGDTFDLNDRTTWKYYLNLAGLYHAFDRDSIYDINVSSGLVEVDSVGNPTNLPVGVDPSKMLIKKASNTGPVWANFTLELLDPTYGGDVAIANEYEFGTSFYQELVDRYPGFEDLILSILHPMPLSISTIAPDGAILYIGGYYRTLVTTPELGTRVVYQTRDDDGRNKTTLIETNESDLIRAVQEYIDGLYVRWFNPGYHLVDDFYFLSFLARLSAFLPITIMNHRKSRCLTPQAHSYHVREFLESHGKLAKYIPALPLEQTLFLYRNVRYIEKNIGKQETFQLLMDRIATPTKVPLAGYMLRHNLAEQPQNLLPTPEAVREAINFRDVGVGKDVFDVSEVLNKEIDLARENGRDLDVVTQNVEQDITHSIRNQLQTKIIESAMIDHTDQAPYPLASFLVNHWLYCSVHGSYNASVFATNPATGDRLHLTPLNAFILAAYCYNRAYHGIPLTTIPTVYARNIPRHNSYQPDPSLAVAPDLATLKKAIHAEDITDQHLVNLIGAGSSNSDYTFTSTAAFYKGCVRLQRQLLNRYKYACRQAEFKAHAEMLIAVSHLYWEQVPCKLSPTSMTYVDWLNEVGIGLAEIEASSDPRAHFAALGDDLVRNATGNLVDAAVQLKNLQEAVIAIMKQFSSYSVQYISSINIRPVIVSGFNGLRVNKPNIKAGVRTNMKLPSVRVMSVNVGVSMTPISAPVGPSIAFAD